MPVGRDFRLSFYAISDLLLAQLRKYRTDGIFIEGIKPERGIVIQLLRKR